MEHHLQPDRLVFDVGLGYRSGKRTSLLVDLRPRESGDLRYEGCAFIRHALTPKHRRRRAQTSTLKLCSDPQVRTADPHMCDMAVVLVFNYFMLQLHSVPFLERFVVTDADPFRLLQRLRRYACDSMLNPPPLITRCAGKWIVITRCAPTSPEGDMPRFDHVIETSGMSEAIVLWLQLVVDRRNGTVVQGQNIRSLFNTM